MSGFIKWLKKHVCEDDAWITVHPNAGGKGSPVLLDDEGYIKGGMGGKFTGQRIDLMPRKSGYGVPASENDPLSASTPGFLRTYRYNLKAPNGVLPPAPPPPQNVASQATNENQNSGMITPNTGATFTPVKNLSSSRLSSKGVQYNEVKTRQGAPLSEDEIIKTISGGDRTAGSCASLGLVYIGQKLGMEVGDFRGGESRDYFSRDINIRMMALDCNVPLIQENSAKSDLSNAKKLLSKLQEGKEYYFSTGSHTAIVKKTGEQYRFLELQSSIPEGNGWKNLNVGKNYDYILCRRFGCSRSSRNPGETYAIDVGEVKGDAFRTILGYINTADADQKRGASGGIR